MIIEVIRGCLDMGGEKRGGVSDANGTNTDTKESKVLEK